MLVKTLFRSQYLLSLFGNCQPLKSVSNCYGKWILSEQHMQSVSSFSNVRKRITESSNGSRNGRISLPHPNAVHFQLNYCMRTFAKHPALRSAEKGNSINGDAGNSAKAQENTVTAGATSTDASSTTTSSSDSVNQENKATTAMPDLNVSSNENKEAVEQNLTVFQRFKKTYKEHGKYLVCVHLVTSGIWFGSFFYAAKLGVDVVPLMEWLGFSDRVINPFRNSSAGDVALAYLMYKLATPARYTVTLAGTNFMIRYLRKTGRMEPPKESESLTNYKNEAKKEALQKTDKFRTGFRDRRVQISTKLVANVKKRQLKIKERREKLASKFRSGKK